MSAAIQRAFAPLGLFATLLTSGAVVAAPANTTPADNCLAAPNTAAPPGHHWYYRTDRATQRKCWYVRAPGQPAQQAAAPPRKSTAKSMESTSAPSGPLPAAEAAPTPVNSADAGRLPPQIEVPASAPPTSAAPNDTAPSIQLAAMAASAGAEPSEPTPNVAPASSATMQDTAPSSIPAAALLDSKTAETSAGPSASAPSEPPAMGAATDKSVPQIAHEEIAASIPAASDPPANTIAPPAIPPLAVTSATLGKVRDSVAAPTDAPVPVSDDAKRTARDGTPTNSSGMLITCSLILVFGLVLVGSILRITRRYAAARRDQVFTDNSGYDPYEETEFLRQLRQGFALHTSWEDTTINQQHPRI